MKKPCILFLSLLIMLLVCIKPVFWRHRLWKVYSALSLHLILFNEFSIILPRLAIPFDLAKVSLEDILWSTHGFYCKKCSINRHFWPANFFPFSFSIQDLYNQEKGGMQDCMYSYRYN